MPIFSNIASTLARQGPKTFTHGYAQSLIAATHPQVYISHNRPGFGLHRASKTGLLYSHLIQNAFVNSSQSSTTVAQVRNEKFEGGLDAYFEAWRKSHVIGEPEKEWTQFQFAKRIEWKPNSVDVDSELATHIEPKATPKSCDTGRPSSPNLPDLSKTEDITKDGTSALAEVDFTLSKEIDYRKDRDEDFETESSVLTVRTTSPINTQTTDFSPSVINCNRPSTALSSTSNSELQSQSYAEHLSNLSKSKKYAEIPAVFEAMLIAGIQPTASAYNSLLNAAVHLPTERINVIPKALDIYSDMLKRKVSPNTEIYDTLLQLLSSRSLEVVSLKQSLEEKRLRFGGIDEQGKFMLASSELEFAILNEDDRINLAIRIFEASVNGHIERSYPASTYHKLIAACSLSGRIHEMEKIYDHMEKSQVLPLGSTFPYMISGLAQAAQLNDAVDRYNIYKKMAIDHDKGIIEMTDRQDHLVYASLVKSYVKVDRMAGALKFYNKIIEAYSSRETSLFETIITKGFIEGLIERKMITEALGWAESLTLSKVQAMARVATTAADLGDKSTAATAFAYLGQSYPEVIEPAAAMLALNVREGNVLAAQYYWQILSHPEITATSAFIEPTAMFAVAMIGSGKVLEGLILSEQMFARIRSSAIDTTGYLDDEIDEGIEFVRNFMSTRGILDPRLKPSEYPDYSMCALPLYQPALAFEDTVDPYGSSTDFKGSALITEELEKTATRGIGNKLDGALKRLESIRHAGLHVRYITYAKLISAAAREGQVNSVHEIFKMAHNDVPLLPQYPIVRYGWISILDAMIGACLILGDRTRASQIHQELLTIGAAPTANTFGLYITTLKTSAQTFDEAADAVKIFHRAKIEGVQPSSFLYNALIGKLGKARRIDDCLFYFAEMRSLGIRPTSVTYGTIVNALCRVSDEKYAEELFEEMESMPNYKPRPAPYNSLMQFFLTSKRDKSKVLSYYERMNRKGIKPTNHTYKLLVDTHASLDPINMAEAEAVLDLIRSTGQKPEAVHYSSLIHAKGCVLHDLKSAKALFDSVISDPSICPQPCLFQALFESMVANQCVRETESILEEMPHKGIDMTPYIANTLIQGWTNEKDIEKAKEIFSMVKLEKREPSTYDAMTRAYLAFDDFSGASAVVKEMMSRNYPGAVSNKIRDLLGNNFSSTS
ncbi:hypothetical protein K3495_g10400 [Podosphaera aphanis]|nr:hypothetical protein K3495_g10400 [Podosphaera aphanis]